MHVKGKRNPNKIGRNDPCPCGSGLKFKRCHYSPRFELPFLVEQARVEKRIEEQARELLEKHKAEEVQRQRQQGLGRPIISTEFQGYRFVAVRNRLYYSEKWKTFTDFLGAYIKTRLGCDWGNAELKKPLEQRHPILQWYHHVCLLQQKYIQLPGEVRSAPRTGAVAAYLGLAYNLYLIDHNVKDIGSRLIERLKNPVSFQGALYETRVAAALINAGFELEYENEDDRSTTHCEFTATFVDTKRQFSVEAKSRTSASEGKKKFKIGRHLHAALQKQANFERLIFIELNQPSGATKDEALRLFHHAVDVVNRLETMPVRGQPFPPAYVCITNFPDQYSLDTPGSIPGAVLLGYKIPDFGHGKKHDSIRAAIRAREKHAEIEALQKSMQTHFFPPSTFDGQLPSAAFGNRNAARLLIGQKYLLPSSDGREIPGVLEDAVVLTQEKQAYGIYRLENGTRAWYTCPLTPEELEDYERHPDTFFGVYKKVSRKTENPIDLFDFFYDSYKDTPKERLLEFMKDAPDLEELRKLSQKDLAEVACERWVYTIVNDANRTSVNVEDE
jgi:SEC-C motif